MKQIKILTDKCLSKKLNFQKLPKLRMEGAVLSPQPILASLMKRLSPSQFCKAGGGGGED